MQLRQSILNSVPLTDLYVDADPNREKILSETPNAPLPVKLFTRRDAHGHYRFSEASINVLTSENRRFATLCVESNSNSRWREIFEGESRREEGGRIKNCSKPKISRHFVQAAISRCSLRISSKYQFFHLLPIRLKFRRGITWA